MKSLRIVSLAPSNTEILFALGLQKNVVAVTRFCDWPPEAARVSRLGTWLQTDPRRIAELKPDLIITSMWVPEALRDWTGPGKHLHLDPKNLWDVFESIRHIGEATHSREAANALVAKMEQGFEVLRQASPLRRPRVYMEEWFDPPMAAGNWMPELVAIAGGEEVLAEINQPSKTFSLAAMAVADPDLIVCHWCGWGERVDRSRIDNREGWENMRAVAEGQTYFINDSLLNRPGPRLVAGAEELQKIFQRYSADL